MVTTWIFLNINLIRNLYIYIKDNCLGRGGWITRSRDRDHPGQHSETPCLLNTKKFSWAWWHVPIIPATQEAETGESFEPRRRRLR